MTRTWQKATISSDAKVNMVMRKMNETGLQSLIICDRDFLLEGTISDGDIRKALVQGCSMNDSVARIMNTNPTVISSHSSRSQILNIFAEHQFKLIPVVQNGVVIGCEYIDDYIGLPYQNVPMLIMAGGFGKRLGELTKETPKPLLKIGGKPIIHRIVEQAKTSGMNKIFISLHYLGSQIRDYFGDGSSFGIDIDYIDEASPLGTAGSIQYLPDDLTGPILVTNADIISNLDYMKLVQHHLSNNADVTMAVHENTIQNPFGVVLTDGISITGFDEKPIWRTRVNAGIYVLDADLKQSISHGERIDMPDLIMRAKNNTKKTIIYELEEDWFDIGNPEDYKKITETDL